MSRQYVVPSVAVFQEFTVVQPDAGRPNRNGDIFPPQTLRDAIAFNDRLIAENQVVREHVNQVVLDHVQVFSNVDMPPTVFDGDAVAGGITRQIFADALRLIGQGRIREGTRMLNWIRNDECKISGELHNISEHLFWWAHNRG